MEIEKNTKMEVHSSVHEQAVKYYDMLGWYVVPLHTAIRDADGNQIGCTCGKNCPGKKQPAVKWNRADCPVRPDRKQTIKLLNHHPGSNIGVITGSRSNNLVVLDFDIPEAFEEFEKYLLLNKYDMTRLVIDKGQKGYHVYFRSKVPIKTAHLHLNLPFWKAEKGIDLLGEGGHCVVPPSRHSSNLTTYEWINSPLNSNSQIPMVPEFLTQYMPISTIDISNIVTQPIDTNIVCVAHNQPLDMTQCNEGALPFEELKNEINSYAENKAQKLLGMMKRPIPPGQSNLIWRKYGCALVDLIRDHNLIVNWYGMVDLSIGITQEKADERVEEVKTRIRHEKASLREGKRKAFGPKFKVDLIYFNKSIIVDTLMDGVLNGIENKTIRRKVAKLTAYFLDCQRVAESIGNTSFFRGFEYILKDIMHDEIFEDKKPDVLKNQLSRMMPFIVKGFRSKDGKDLNLVPIFECLFKAKPIRKGEERPKHTSEYRLNDEYRWLLDL